MSEIKDGGPAFPCEWDYINSNRSPANGMTLRDYFAAKAPDRALDVSDWSTATCEEALGLESGSYRWREHYPLLLAKLAYEYADAMLKARQS